MKVEYLRFRLPRETGRLACPVQALMEQRGTDWSHGCWDAVLDAGQVPHLELEHSLAWHHRFAWWAAVQPCDKQRNNGSKRALLCSQVSLDLNFHSWFVFSPKFYPTSWEIFVFNEPVQIPVPAAVHQLLGCYIQMYTCCTLVNSIYNWILLLCTPTLIYGSQLQLTNSLINQRIFTSGGCRTSLLFKEGATGNCSDF